MQTHMRLLEPRAEPYEVVCEKVQQKTNRNGKPYINLTFRQLKGVRYAYEILYTTKNARNRSRTRMNEFLIASGHRDPNQVKGMSELIGRTCGIVVAENPKYADGFPIISEFVVPTVIPKNALDSDTASDIFGFKVGKIEPLPLKVRQLVNQIMAELKKANQPVKRKRRRRKRR